MLLAIAPAAFGQTPPPSIAAGALGGGVAIDGRLDEPAWASAVAIDTFTQTDPREGAPASARTRVRVLAGPKALVVGIECDQPPGTPVVSFSVRRDAALNQEDHVRLVLGPFMDGRSGYVFVVNPSGARYDGIVNPGGENDNAEWDGIWDAVAIRRDGGWSAEVWIPFLTLSFNPELDTWHFNVQRRIQGENIPGSAVHEGAEYDPHVIFLRERGVAPDVETDDAHTYWLVGVDADDDGLRPREDAQPRCVPRQASLARVRLDQRIDDARGRPRRLIETAVDGVGGVERARSNLRGRSRLTVCGQRPSSTRPSVRARTVPVTVSTPPHPASRLRRSATTLRPSTWRAP